MRVNLKDLFRVTIFNNNYWLVKEVVKIIIKKKYNLDKLKEALSYSYKIDYSNPSWYPGH